MALIHSLVQQQKRLANIEKFKSNKSQILIATDVASRGLDIQNVDLVINFDLPRSAKDYVHRVGRTARAGRRGKAYSFVTQYDLKLLYSIEEYTKEKLKKEEVDEDKVLEDQL